MPESTLNLLLSGLMGLFGGLITLPFNYYFTSKQRQEEIVLQHRLDRVAKVRELILQHELEIKRQTKDDDLMAIKDAIKQIQGKINNGK